MPYRREGVLFHRPTSSIFRTITRHIYRMSEGNGIADVSTRRCFLHLNRWDISPGRGNWHDFLLSTIHTSGWDRLIEVQTSNEDPAYPILRKVIGLSYVHLNQISSYSADIYIRGTVKFENIPSLIRNQLKRQNIDVKSGDVLVNETVSQIDYRAPDKYEQHILSINSTFPKVVDFSADEFIKASLYQDNINILFTPLDRCRCCRRWPWLA